MVTRAQIEAQIAVTQARERAQNEARLRLARERAEAGAVATHKWTLLRTLSEIREGLGVSDRSLGVLSALLSFHPETALTLEGDGLVVFPSNKALCLRANGISEPTLRRHLSALVEAGLIIRRDSPNGKRFARREADGAGAAQVFGFDLAPLVARAGEFDRRLEAQRCEQRRARLLKERINLLRRDLTKRIAFGLDEGLVGPWEALRHAFLCLCTPLRKLRGIGDFEALAADLDGLAREVTRALESAIQNPIADAAQNERRSTESNPNQITDLDPAPSEAGGQREANAAVSSLAESPEAGVKTLPLALVLDACPDIRDYDFSGGKLDSWPAFLAVAATVRPMLGISADAWRDALATIGEKNAAVALAFILQRCEHSSDALRQTGPDGREIVIVHGSPAIRSPGGYLRALTQKGRQEPFTLWGAILGQISRKTKMARRRQVDIS
jgi:replication initiation protein RepC